MSPSENPWLDVLSQPQRRSTEEIVPYFNKQDKMLSVVSGDKVKGLYSRTVDVSRILDPALDLAESASTVVSRVISGNAALCAPNPISKMLTICTGKMIIALRFVRIDIDSGFSLSNLVHRILPLWLSTEAYAAML